MEKHSLSKTQVLLEGREQVEDKPRAGRPSTSKMDNVERVRSLVRSDHWLTLTMISSELNLNWFIVHQILTQDLDMRKVCAKMKWSQNSSVALSQVMNHGFWSMTLRQNAKVGSGTLQNLPISRKPEWKIQNQIDSHLFFWQSGDRPQGICATRKNCQSNVLSASPWKTQEKGGMCATRHCMHLDAAPRQRPMSQGSLH